MTPAAGRSPAPSRADAVSRPELSVLLPCDDPRGDPSEAVLSWTARQTCPPDRFEVIALSEGSDPAHDRRLARLLRPHDRLLCRPGRSLLELYRDGAREATGRWLLVTEGHCLAEPDCIGAVLRFAAAHPGVAGGWLRSGHRNDTVLAGMEARLYEATVPAWSSPGGWNRVHLRGFAIDRAAYLAAGGLEPAYGLFAAAGLAIRLHREGRRLAHIPEAVVTHVNTPDFRLLTEHVSDYARGECRYFVAHGADRSEPYLGWPAAWAGRHRLAAGAARRELAALARLWLWRRARRRPDRARWTRGLSGEALARVPPALIGPCWSVAVARAQVGWARVRTRLAVTEARRLAHYRRAWEAVAHRARVEWLAGRADAWPAVPPLPLGAPLADLPEPARLGFHGRETADGQPFRWTMPVAGLRLNVPRADLRLIIDTRSLRGDPRGYLVGAALNGQPLPDLAVEAGRIVARLPAHAMCGADVQWLLLAAEPLGPRRAGAPDGRALGIPVFSVAVSADCSATGPG